MIFAKSGVEHVICIDYKEAVLDKAAILFSRIFYSTLFKSEMSICKCFESAKTLVYNKFGIKESDKFQIITQGEKHVCDSSNPIS